MTETSEHAQTATSVSSCHIDIDPDTAELDYGHRRRDHCINSPHSTVHWHAIQQLMEMLVQCTLRASKAVVTVCCNRLSLSLSLSVCVLVFLNMSSKCPHLRAAARSRFLRRTHCEIPSQSAKCESRCPPSGELAKPWCNGKTQWIILSQRLCHDEGTVTLSSLF